MKEYKFISENKGISQKTQKPYHSVKLHDPETYQNHSVMVDVTKVLAPFNYAAGQTVTVELELSTPFDRTNPLLVGVYAVTSK